MMGEKNIFLKNEKEMSLFAGKIASQLKAGDFIGLRGEVGVGKTTFARALIRALTKNPYLEVPSPTFSLIQTYEAEIEINHLDLYRLENSTELYSIGIEELMEGAITIIEWSEKGEAILPQETIRIQFFYKKEGRYLNMTFSDSANTRFF